MAPLSEAQFGDLPPCGHHECQDTARLLGLPCRWQDPPVVRDSPYPGMRVFKLWRGERLREGVDPANPGSVGIHWTMRPSVAQHFAMLDDGPRVIWTGQVREDQLRTMPGRRAVMKWPEATYRWDNRLWNNEAERRIIPGSTIKLVGRRVFHDDDELDNVWAADREAGGDTRTALFRKAKEPMGLWVPTVRGDLHYGNR